MNNEPKVVRRNPRFGSALSPDQMIQKYSRSDPNWHVPFEDDANCIRATKWDKRVGWGVAVIGAAYLVGLFTGWLS